MTLTSGTVAVFMGRVFGRDDIYTLWGKKLEFCSFLIGCGSWKRCWKSWKLKVLIGCGTSGLWKSHCHSTWRPIKTYKKAGIFGKVYFNWLVLGSLFFNWLMQKKSWNFFVTVFSPLHFCCCKYCNGSLVGYGGVFRADFVGFRFVSPVFRVLYFCKKHVSVFCFFFLCFFFFFAIYMGEIGYCFCLFFVDAQYVSWCFCVFGCACAFFGWYVLLNFSIMYDNKLKPLCFSFLLFFLKLFCCLFLAWMLFIHFCDIECMSRIARVCGGFLVWLRCCYLSDILNAYACLDAVYFVFPGSLRVVFINDLLMLFWHFFATSHCVASVLFFAAIARAVLVPRAKRSIADRAGSPLHPR